MRHMILYLVCALLCAPSTLLAEANMKRMSSIDERTVSFGYNPDQVYTVDLYVGYITQFQFSSKETIVDTGSGLDAESVWQTAEPAPHIFTIKPKILTGDTNVVFTTKIGAAHRTYMFHFRIKQFDPDTMSLDTMVWKVKFWYPRPKRAAVPKKATEPPPRPDLLSTPESERNYSYLYSGNARLVPGIAFDNGTFTFFRFSPDRDWPLIYAVDMQTGNERLVNTRREGPDVIVEGVYDILVLRYGREHACIFNGARVKPTERDVSPVLVRVRAAEPEDESSDATTVPAGTGGDQ